MNLKEPKLAFNVEIHKPITVSDAVASISSGTSVNSEDTPVSDDTKLGVLKTSCVSDGRFIPSENKTILKSEYSRVKQPVKSGEVIVSRMNTPLLVGEVGYVTSSHSNLFLPDRLWALKVQQNFNARWLTYYLTTPKIKFRLKELATGTSGSMKNISQPSFLGIQLHAPKHQEQQKIADFLTAVDTKINQITEKHRLLKEYKKGVMQQLFSQKIRFKDEGDKAFPDWTQERLDYFIERISDPVSVDSQTEYREIGIRSHGKGIFHKESTTGDDIGNKRVFWVKPNALVLNIVFAWERAVAVTSNDENGFIASHRFPMYIPKANRADVNYLLYFFLSPKGEALLNLASPGGAGRNKTLGQSEFMKLKVRLPSQQEQQKIAQFLQALDSKIAAVSEQIEQTKQFKKGLLQQMFV
ncbi:restriction endonuclease subunit S [Vibrio fluvialis]|nr:restriction endonuclease subunit S [Vibrio fluvialis]ELX7504057.1 restriction endonuclease subunit S [Vibrio fluvialis]